MNPEDFQETISGHLISIPEGGFAYVPNPLPPRNLTWDSGLIEVLSLADRALGELAGIGRSLPNPHLLVRPFLRREAVLSSRIEGTQASLADVLAFEAIQLPLFDAPHDVREVHNYVRALEYGLERMSSLPVSLRLICELHGILLEGVRGEQFRAGEFRQGQNFIGPPGGSLATATFVPPPPKEMMETLQQLELYINEASNLPPLIRLGIIHYQFEAIHPFPDGNGRLGRLLVPLLLCAWNLLPQPLLYLSAFFETNRPDYYANLRGVSEKGNWNAWLSFFLSGVSSQAIDAAARVKRINDLRENYRQRFQQGRSAARLLQVVDLLFARPLISVRTVEEELALPYPTAERYIDELVKQGILEGTGKARNRVFRANEILQVIEKSV
ncbi:MAG: Fic family protein [Anaerolineaceae bacterium]|nr:Fic family protein [Anaerolineaceae bacterium]